MITIISGTNRPNSKTKLVADACYEYLSLKSDKQISYIDLTDINVHFLTDNMYSKDGQHAKISEIQDSKLIPSDHWLIVSPEYNGSFPGILKAFIDAVSVRRYKESFSGKKATLIGLASGKAGNFRGMEHLTGLLNYLNVLVMPNKLPISSIEKQLDNEGKLNQETLQILHAFLDNMLIFNKVPFS